LILPVRYHLVSWAMPLKRRNGRGDMRSNVTCQQCVAVLALCLTACMVSSPRVGRASEDATSLARLPGLIRIDVRDPTTEAMPPPTYVFSLRAGTLVSGGDSRPCQFSSDEPTLPPAGEMRYEHPYAVNSERSLLAVSAKPARSSSLVSNDIAVFSLPEGKQQAFLHRPESAFVEGIAWSPDSRYLALLTAQEHWGVSPLELLTAVAGHPVPHNSYRIEVYSRSGELVGATPFITGFVATSARLCWR